MDYHNGIASVGHPYDYSFDRSLTSEPDTSPPQSSFAQLSTLSSLPETPSESVQVISSLIDSLSKISASTYVRQAPTAETNIHISTDEYSRSPSTEPPDADDLDREQNDPPVADESSEGEAAAPPVIKYARRPPPLSKRSSRSFIRTLSMSSQPALAARESMQSLKSRAESDSVGLPSIERRDRSSASSTFSFVSGLSSTLKRQTAESIYDMATTRPAPPRRVSSDRRRKTESLYSMEQEKENKWSTRSPSVDGYSTSSTHLDQGLADGPTVAALRLSRGDLGSHMIPSRRSSLRHSVTGISDGSQDQHSRHSFSGRDLKELNIDAELIEGDNSTVRRIRELQEAREKRQKEWRHEARKSERASKRHTIATPKLSSQRSSPYQSSRLSVTEVVVESPEVESPLDLSATVTPSDLAGMPAFVTEPPGETHSLPVPPRPATPNPPSAAPSRGNSLYRNSGAHTKRNSAGFTIKQDPALTEMKSITEEVEAFLGAPRFTQKIRHPRTGRTIAFSEVGDPNGFVVLCCVGMGLTRYLTAFYDELARTLRLRLITPDRPGVGASSPLPESQCTPLNWVDDVAVLCASLEITRFSLLAHSAGVIYALATALKMPQYVRGRIHLLAPWIPPSQMPKGAAVGPDSQPIANLPLTHKILSVLPAQILKVANSRFLTATSASVDTKPLKSKKNKQMQIENLEVHLGYPVHDLNEDSPFRDKMPEFEPDRPSTGTPNRARGMSCYQANNETLGIQGAPVTSPRQTVSSAKSPPMASRPMSPRLSPEARHALYNQTLTHRIWTLATQNANPATDLVVCLERRRAIGFRYPEVTRSVVIHHGAKDSRVPLDNVRWLHSVMKRCELRVLDDEGHGLMASASAMATVLSEIAKEWEEWEKIAQNKEKRKRSDAASAFSRGRSFHSRFVDASYREAASRDS
ncbi:hypothetical protein PV04_06664 [Phialophora macrospora]|uniref:AB hydrolase-1 domain-containing protein n=1 Tax=Phialophora macrospora TaxID=1851006 RepID=A0A0D2FKZ6_9EURO|nr:hypothetical protein PV04_06664 [Phialophora macrospora]